MSQLKSIIFTALFCLSFCTAQLYAVTPNESNPQKHKKAFSLGVIVKSLDGTVNGIGKSIGGTIDGLGKSLGGTVNGIGKSLDGTMNGIGSFLEETGEVAAEVAQLAIVVGVALFYIIAEADCHYYNYDYPNGYREYNHQGYYPYNYYGYDQCYHGW